MSGPARHPTSIRIDPWSGLRRHTPARIALGRAGGSLPTAELLRFAVDHALARDAVDERLDVAGLATALGGIALASRAPDRRSYLQRPDLGRQLNDASRTLLGGKAGAYDVAIVIGDGLSACAARIQASPLLAMLVPALHAYGMTVAPVTVVDLARVAVGDEVGMLLGARLVIMLLGERPGLGCADSLGAYLTWAPAPGKRDSERTCVSNIRAAGHPTAEAAATIVWLCREALRRNLTGTALKDERCVLGSNGHGSEEAGRLG